MSAAVRAVQPFHSHFHHLHLFSQNVENLRNYKGLVAPGTDAGAWAVPHGSATEETLLAGAGIDGQRLEQGISIIHKKF